ncbi:hypothetical protein KJN74_01805 [Candidatus Bathyarchaeota archaeon]|nr:hypothetical protein [Candidatus Bathyarchaeota archaeon]
MSTVPLPEVIVPKPVPVPDAPIKLDTAVATTVLVAADKTDTITSGTLAP